MHVIFMRLHVIFATWEIGENVPIYASYYVIDYWILLYILQIRNQPPPHPKKIKITFCQHSLSIHCYMECSYMYN